MATLNTPIHANLATASALCASEAAADTLARLADIAGISFALSARAGELPPAVLRLEEEAGEAGTVRAEFHPAWAGYFTTGELVLGLDDEEALLELMIAAGSIMRGPVIGVLGAHGGAGATTVAATLAAVLAADHDVAFVDADPLSAGVGHWLGVVDGGLTWADISAKDGFLVPGRLVAALPEAGRLRLLGPDGRGGLPHLGDLGERAVAAVSQKVDATVVDLGREALLARPGLVDWCDLLLVVSLPTEQGLRQAARLLDAVAARRHAMQAASPLLVVNRASGGAQAAAAAMEAGANGAFVVREMRTLRRDLEHGLLLGQHRRASMQKDIQRIAAACMEAA